MEKVKLFRVTNDTEEFVAEYATVKPGVLRLPPNTIKLGDDYFIKASGERFYLQFAYDLEGRWHNIVGQLACFSNGCSHWTPPAEMRTCQPCWVR